MDSSKLNRRIVYQVPNDAASANKLNQKPRTYVAVATVSAQIRTPSGREIWHAQQLQALLSHVIVARYQSGFQYNPRGRFLYQTPTFNTTPRYFNITWVANVDEGNREVLMYTTEVASPVPTS